jgi:hypothetical protein
MWIRLIRIRIPNTGVNPTNCGERRCTKAAGNQEGRGEPQQLDASTIRPPTWRTGYYPPRIT